VGFPDVELTLRSCYDGPERSSFFLHRDYLEELMGRPGRVTFFNVICKTPQDLPGVASAIDALFANSEAPTVTETEKAFQASFVEMLGNVRLLLRGIALACGFAMLCVAANTLAMTARERAHEIAILKTLGFSPGLVLALLLAEVAVLCGASAALGAGAAKCLFAIDGPWHDLGGGFLRGFRLRTGLALAALPGGVAIGWVSAIVPFAKVAFAPIAPALRRAG
jgi:putative ABC transport system permease protein